MLCGLIVRKWYYNDDDDGLGLGESLFWEDIKQWVEAMQLVNEAAVSLRTAQPDAEIAAATQRSYFEASRARDCKSCPPARGEGCGVAVAVGHGEASNPGGPEDRVA